MNRKHALALVLVLVGCGVKEGPQGPTGLSGPTGPRGAEGPPGPGFDATPAIASVSPGLVVVGQTLDVAIVGNATEWTNGAIVAFGNGITVNSTISPSPVALIVNVTIDKAAMPGTRDITVTQNGKVTTWKGAFKVNPLYKAEVLGKPGRGALALVRITAYDPDFTFDTSWNGTSYLGVRATSSPPSNIVVQEVTARKVDLLVTGDTDSVLGMRDLRLVNQFGRPGERSFLFPALFEFADLVELTVDAGTTTGAFAQPYGSAEYKFFTSSTLEHMASVTSTGGAGAPTGHPMLAMMSSTGKFTGVTVPLTNSYTFTPYSTYYFVVFDPTGASGFNYNFTLQQLNRTNEVEPNDEKTSAPALVPPALLTASLSSATDVDYFKIVVTDNEVGRHLRVRTRYGTTGQYSTDTKIDVFRPDGQLFGSSPDTTYHEELRTDALPSTGEWLVKVSNGNYYPPWASYKSMYELLVNWE